MGPLSTSQLLPWILIAHKARLTLTHSLHVQKTECVWWCPLPWAWFWPTPSGHSMKPFFPWALVQGSFLGPWWVLFSMTWFIVSLHLKAFFPPFVSILSWVILFNILPPKKNRLYTPWKTKGKLFKRGQILSFRPPLQKLESGLRCHVQILGRHFWNSSVMIL